MFGTGVVQGACVTILLFCQYVVQNNSQIISRATQPVLIGNPNIVHATFATFSCSSSGNPVPIITWKLGNENVLFVKTSPIVNNLVNSSVTFLALVEDNGKNLSCIVDQMGDSTLRLTDYVTLRISYVTTPKPAAPVVSVSKSQYMVTPGSQITFSCSIQSTLSITEIYWKKTSGGSLDIRPNTNTDKYIITNDVLSSPQTSVLVIRNVENSDAGGYVCFANTSEEGGTSNEAKVYVVTFSVSTTPYNKLVGDRVILYCTINGITNYTINWYKDGQLLNLGSDNRYVDGTIVIPSLTINSLRTTDSGKYVARIMSGGDSLNSPEITLNVDVGSGPQLTVSTEPYIVNSGERVTLTCSVPVGTTLSDVYWTKTQTGEIIRSSTIGYSGITTANPSMTINNVTSSNAGSYVCHAVNSVNGQTGNSSEVSVTVIDTIQSEYSKNAGESVTLACNVNSPSTSSYSVSWYKNGVLLSTTSNTNKYQGGNTSVPSLTIKSLTARDGGTYSCQITSGGITKSSSSISLTVVSAAPMVTVPSTHYFVNAGGAVTILCSSSPSGASLSEVYWVWTPTNGVQQRLYSFTSVRYTGISTNNPSITISSVSASDAGEYVCYSRSTAGVTGNSETVNVNVITFPTNPISVTPGGSVTLTANIDGPAISTLIWYRNNAQISVDGTKYRNGNKFTPSLTISSLTTSDSGSYYFRVTSNGRSYTSQSVDLNIQQGNVPQVILPATYKGSEGGFIILNSQVTPTEGLLNITWTLPSGSTNLASPQNKYAGGTVNTPPLYIYFLDSTADSGTYICSATNSAGTGTAATTLTVYKAPQSVQITPSSLSVNSGDPISLTCVADGVPTQNFTWTKGSSVVSSSNTMYISAASASDGGVYTCDVTNVAGSLSTTITVTVITVSSQQYTPKEGENVTLVCNVSGLSSTTVTWYKDGQVITSRGTKYFNGNSAQPSLTIKPVTSSDTGTYVCSVDGAGVTKNSSDISVLVGRAPTVSIPEPRYTGSVGGSITILCNINPRTDLQTVAWYFNGVVINVASLSSKYLNGNRFNSALTILQLNSADNGNYMCRATNPSGTGTSQPTKLTVFTVTVTTTRYTPTETQNVTLSCNVALSSYTVTWYKNGQQIILPNSRYRNGVYPIPSLTIISVDNSDSGLFVCSISSGGFTKNGSTIEVSVQQQQIPPSDVITFNPSSVSVNVGERIQVTASASGSPTPVYRWSKNNVVVHTGQTLVIDSATVSDGGLYIITASNSAGETNGSISIVVNAQEVIATKNKYSALVGDHVIMGCSVRGMTNYVITWYKDGEILQRSDNRYQNGNANVPSLTISPVIASDTGKYICSATGRSSGVSTNSTEMSLNVGVTAPQNVMLDPSTLALVEGNPINVRCTADGTSPVYTWTKGGVRISNNRLLYIENPDKSDDGEYVCTASNSAGTKSAVIDIDVQYRPVITTKVNTVITSIGSIVTLSCDNDANPRAHLYEWSYGSRIDKLNSSSLVIYISDDNSFIDYTCKATNTRGSSETHTFTLTKEDSGVVGASIGGGLSIAEIIAILLGILLLLLLLLLLIYCCCMRGLCAACCGSCCGKKKKDSKARVYPGAVSAGKPKVTVHHIDIPRFYEVPNWKPKASSTASAVSRQDVHMMAGPDYYRSDDYEINAKMHLTENGSQGGTIISMYDDKVNTPRDYHLPPLDYPEVSKEERKKRRKKKKPHHREAGEGQEDSGVHLVNGAV